MWRNKFYLDNMAQQEKASQLVGQFPWGHYITEDLRSQMTLMVEMYLEADTFNHAQDAYDKFMNAYYRQPFFRDRKNGKNMMVVDDWYYRHVDKWHRSLKQAWLEIHGPRHTRDEVMKIAADFWCERIFDSSRQDNGDNSNAGFLGMMMASMLKSNSMKKQDSSVRDKAWYLIAEYYGKVFDKTIPNCFEDGLIVDYNPCEELHNILKEAGLDEIDIDCIVPIKTSLSLRDFDKSLVGTSGYHNFVDL